MKLKEIAENHGLTPKGVDYALTQYQIVICEITHGMMSKLSYDAKDIIRVAQERWCDTCDLKEPVEPSLSQKEIDFRSEVVDAYKCGNCEYELGSGWRYCPMCGKAVKWDAAD